MKTLEIWLAITALASGLSATPCRAADPPSGTSEFDELIRDPVRLRDERVAGGVAPQGVGKVFVLIKLGDKARTEAAGTLNVPEIEKAITDPLRGDVSEFINNEEDADSVLFTYVEIAAPPKPRHEYPQTLPLHALSLKMQLWRKSSGEKQGRGPRQHKLIWRYPLFGTSWDDQLQSNVLAAIAIQATALRDDIRTSRQPQAAPAAPIRLEVSDACDRNFAANRADGGLFVKAVATDLGVPLAGTTPGAILAELRAAPAEWTKLDGVDFNAKAVAAKDQAAVGNFVIAALERPAVLAGTAPTAWVGVALAPPGARFKKFPLIYSGKALDIDENTAVSADVALKADDLNRVDYFVRKRALGDGGPAAGVR